MGLIIRISDGAVIRPSDSDDSTTGETYITDNVPAGANLHEYVYSSGNLVRRDSIENLDNMKAWAERFHEYLGSLSSRLEGREAILWDADVVAKAHNWIKWLHFGTNVVVGRRTTALASLTITQRINFLKQSLLGPAGLSHRVATPTEDQVKARIHEVYGIIDGIDAPTIPVIYINPTNATPVTLQNAVSTSTTLGLNGVTDFTGTHAVDIDGTWIGNITE